MRRFVIGIIALVTAVLSALVLASAASAFGELGNQPSAQHVADGSPSPASLNDLSERGPPVARDLATNYDAVDSWSHGASPCLDGTTPHANLAYQLAGRLAQPARDSRGVEERSGSPEPEAAFVPRLDVAANGADDVVRALSATERKTLDDALRPDKLDHIFDPKHNFEPLVQQFGSREAAMEQIVRRIGGPLPAAGRFEIAQDVGGQMVVIRGAVVDGVPRIGTAFTP